MCSLSPQWLAKSHLVREGLGTKVFSVEEASPAPPLGRGHLRFSTKPDFLELVSHLADDPCSTCSVQTLDLLRSLGQTRLPPNPTSNSHTKEIPPNTQKKSFLKPNC